VLTLILVFVCVFYRQSVVIAILAKLGLIPTTEFYDYNIDDIAAATQVGFIIIPPLQSLCKSSSCN